MRFLFIFFTILNISFSGALYFGLDVCGTSQYGDKDFIGTETKSNALTIGYNHGIMQWDNVSLVIGGSYTLTPMKFNVDDTHRIDAAFLTFNTSAWYKFSDKISGWASIGINKPMDDIDDGDMGLTCGLGLYYSINDTVGIGLGTTKNNTKDAYQDFNEDLLFNRTVMYVGYLLN